MTLVRSRLFDLFSVVWTALFALPIPVLVLLGSPPRAVRALTRAWVRGLLLGLRAIVGLGHAETGRSNVPGTPCLIVANHQSTWETLAFLVLFPEVAIVAKQELLAIPVFGWYLRRSPMIVIDRDDGTGALRTMIEASRDALAQGRSVLIFPEGTRKAPGEPVVFKRGVELLYARLGVPALPVAVDSGRFWRTGDPFKRPGRIRVSILPPVDAGLPGAAFTRSLEAALNEAKAA